MTTPSTSAAPPDLPPLPPPTTGATFWVRVAARVLDSIALMAISWMAGVAAGVGLVVAGISPERAAGLHAATLIGGGVAGLAYHAIAEAWVGATPGKLCLGLRVVAVDGGRASFGAALLRSLAYYVDALFFGMPAYSSMSTSEPRRQRYGDLWAKTMVVSKSEPGIRQVPSFAAVARVTLAAILVATVVDVAGIFVAVL
jgi:uncharacterized RDD family membrane protein YckC